MASDEVVCRPWVEQDMGPYHRDNPPARADIAEDRAGVPLRLDLRVIDGDDRPVVGAELDVWHCDAHGRYSGFPAPSDEERDASTARREETFLRGCQRTDAGGHCELRTIYPGWYGGRSVHIHVIATIDGRRHVSQLFFPDELTDTVHALPAYATRGARDTRNADDDIYSNDGEATLLSLIPEGAGYRGAICFRIDDRS